MKRIRSGRLLSEKIQKFFVIFSALIILIQPGVVFADNQKGELTPTQLQTHAQNNAPFYNPAESDCKSTMGNCVAPTGSQITFIADSLTAMAGKEMFEEVFPGADYGPEYNTANSYVQSGKQIGADGYGSANPDGLTVLNKIVAEGKLRPFLVFALGANDPWDLHKDYITKLLDLTGNDTKILILTTKTIPPHTYNYDSNNEYLKEIGAQYDNVYIGDWASAVKDEYYDTDGLHYTKEGFRAYLEFIKQNLPQSCSAGLLAGNTVEERIWNYFVQANIPGVSDNPAVISGILGNFYIESGYNPFMLGATPTYRGLYMLADIFGGYELRDKINAAIGKDYWKFYGWWGSPETVDEELAQVNATQSEIDTAIKITLDYLTSQEVWQWFVDGLNEVEYSSGTEGAGSYAELFEGLVENAFDDTGKGTPFHDSKVATYVRTKWGPHSGYQGVNGRREAAQSAFSRLSTMTTAKTTSGTTASSGGYTKYELTDDQLWDLAEVAIHENNANLRAFKNELSIMANLLESPLKGQGEGYGGKYTPISGDALWNYVKTGGWFSKNNSALVNGKHDETVSSERLEAARDVLINGNRTLPTQILEHDYVGDITSATNNGVEVEKEEWEQGVTIIKNKYGSTWIFYGWMGGITGIGDPMGYFEGNPPTKTVTDAIGDAERCEEDSSSGPGGAIIAQAAIKMAWPIQSGQDDDSHVSECQETNGQWITWDPKKGTCFHNPRPLYKEQKQKLGVGGSYYEDCGWFVSTVIHYTKVDTEFPKGGADNMNRHMSNSDKWDEVTNDGTQKDLMPGDVFASSNHIFIYVGEYGGTYGEIAEASAQTRVGGIMPINDWVNNSGSQWIDVDKEAFHIYRLKSSIGENGLTFEEAKKFMMHYGENKNNSTELGLGNASGLVSVGCAGGGISNCVTFSAFFVNKFTPIKFADAWVGHGGEFVGNLSGVEKGNEPRVFAVFSAGGHTGVILGHQDGEWIVGQADCNSPGTGKGNGGDGTYAGRGSGSGFVLKSSDIGTAQLVGEAHLYAYPEVDLAAIQSYLETGL